MILRLAGLWLRGLVALYPPGFRTAVGGELSRLLRDQARDAHRRGPGALGWYVTRETIVCLRDAVLEWHAALMETANGESGGGVMRWESWLHDLRLSVRGLLRRPGYSVPVLLTLALGIGASTAMFDVLHGVVLAPLPYPHPDRLVEVFPADPDRGVLYVPFSLPDVQDWEERSRTLAAMGGYTTLPSDLILTGGADAVEVPTAFVTPGFFTALGTEPQLGRTFRPADDDGDNRVVVVSHGFWQRRFGSDPSAVGRTLELSGGSYRVVGVMPPEVAFPDPDVDVWVLLSTIPASSIPLQIRGVRLLQAIARLAPGVTLDDARGELSSIAADLAATYPDSNERVPGATVRPLREGLVGDVAGALRLLMAAGAVILLIMCANLANLALVRETRRAPDMAVRSALGASRRQRVMGVLTENLVLAVVGGALGLALAVWGTDLLMARSAQTLPRAGEVGLDWTVGGFALLVSLAAGFAFALIPGLRAGGTDLSLALREGGQRATGRGGGALVASQVALAVVLLVGAGLLARSLAALGRVDPGFDPEGLVVAAINFPSSRYPDRPAYLARYDATLEGLQALPGVASAASIRRFPFRGEGEAMRWRVPDDPQSPEDGLEGSLLQVSSGIFATLDVPFLEGGTFSAIDDRDGRSVVVVNRTLARAAFGSGPAVGRYVDIGLEEPLEVVGVVDDLRQQSLVDEVPPTFYVPEHLNPRRGAAFVLRTSDGVEGVLRGVRDLVRTQDPDQPITELTTASAVLSRELARPRFFALLLTLFAVLALALCAVGVYGVVSFGVSRRRREMGIRMAVGASGRDVVVEVVRGGLRPLLVGIVAGGAVALFAVRSMEALLYGVGLYDPLAYATGVLIIGAVGLAACSIPALRAARTRPVEVLTEA